MSVGTVTHYGDRIEVRTAVELIREYEKGV